MQRHRPGHVQKGALRHGYLELARAGLSYNWFVGFLVWGERKLAVTRLKGTVKRNVTVHAMSPCPERARRLGPVLAGSVPLGCQAVHRALLRHDRACTQHVQERGARR